MGEHVREKPEEQLERLQRQVSQLQAANKELSDFAYSVAHDLRSPLTQILCCAGLLLSLPSVSANLSAFELARQVEMGARKMSGLIDDYLAFCSQGGRELKRERVSLEALVQIVLQELEPLTKGRTIVWRIGRLPETLGDASMLRQALSNLLSNAIKYTCKRSDAEIEVGVFSSGKELIVFVRDNGVGFDMSDAGKLFQKFQRLHKGSDFPGSGLGLVIVQNIIHRHGGKIWAESAPGKGATFYFSLPGSD